MECTRKLNRLMSRPTGKKFTLGKLNCSYQWRPTGKKFALGELCPLTRLPVTCGTDHPSVSGLRLFKTLFRGRNGSCTQQFRTRAYIDVDVFGQTVQPRSSPNDVCSITVQALASAAISSGNRSLKRNSVRFQCAYLQKKRNPLVQDQSHHQSKMAITYAIFEGENSESNVINTVKLGLSMCMKRSNVKERAFTTSANVPSIYIQLFWNALTHDAKTGRSLLHDNIVPKPDLALELGKSISLTEAEEEAVAREVHATHARIVNESEPKPTQRRQSGIAFRDSFIVSKKSSSLVLLIMMSAQISSGLAPQCIKMFEHSSSSLGLHCQKTFKQISSNLVSQMSQRRLLASLQAPFLKEKKGVRFSALYLQQKRNLLVLDHSHQQVSYFFHARSVVKWINVDQLIGKGNLLLDLQKLQKNPIFCISVDIRQNTNFVRAFTTSANVPSIYIQLFWNTLTHDAKTGALNVTPADSAHPFESPPAGKTDITFTRRRVPSNWLMKMKFNRLLNLIWMIMSTIYNKRWIIASQDETTGPSVHLEDATSTKMVGSNSEQSHVALAGPNPEHMHDVFLATNYPKVHESLKHTTKEHVHLENPPSSSRTLSSMKNLEDS
ncbi:hypothetical protein Tco_1200977 [Tanacetum coccineum]